MNAVFEDGDGIEEYQWTNGYQPQFGQQLSFDQKEEVRQLLSQFHQVTKDNLGSTDKATHRIRTIGSAPVRQEPYRISHAYQEKVLEELEDMEKNGTIKRRKVSGRFQS